EIAIIERCEGLLEHLLCARDVDHDAVRIELFREKCHANDKGRPVHVLSRAEHLAPKRMGNHDLVGDFNRVHEGSQSLSSAAGYRISGQTPSAPQPKTEGNVAGSSSNFMAGASERR